MEKIFETHCHVFNKQVLSKRIISLVLPLANILNIRESSKDKSHIENAIKQIEAALKVATKASSEEVFDVINSEYGKNVVFTPLMIDLSYADRNEATNNLSYKIRREMFVGVLSSIVAILKKRASNNKEISKKLDELFNEKRGSVLELLNFSEDVINKHSYLQQIADLESIAEKHSNVKPFFGVDPRRAHINNEDIVQKIKQKISMSDSKFHGIKLYAPNGFSPTDPVLFGTDSTYSGVYKYCEDNRIPITIHCSNSGFACMADVITINGHININGIIKKSNNEKYRFSKKFYSIYVSQAIEERAHVLNHPKLWKLVLERFPNLTINFAHFGGSTQIEEYISYKIPFEKLGRHEYYNLLSELDEEQKTTVESSFRRRLGYFELKKNLSSEETKKLWNTFYFAGLIDNWSKAIFDIIRDPKYPNAYADLSSFSTGSYEKGKYSIYNSLKSFKNNFFDKLTPYEKGKFLYGSDFFLILFFGPAMKDYISDFKKVFGDDFSIIAAKNPKRFLNLE